MQWKLKQFLKLGGGVCNQGELNRKQAGIATRDNGSQGLAFFKIPTTNGFAPVFRIRNGIGSFPHRTDGAVRGSLMELEWKACNSVWRETGGLVVSGTKRVFTHCRTQRSHWGNEDGPKVWSGRMLEALLLGAIFHQNLPRQRSVWRKCLRVSIVWLLDWKFCWNCEHR